MEPIVFEMPYLVSHASGKEFVIGKEHAEAVARTIGGTVKQLSTNVPTLKNFGLNPRVTGRIETTHRALVRMLWRVCQRTPLTCTNPQEIVKSRYMTEDESGIDAPSAIKTEPEAVVYETVPNFYGMTKQEIKLYAEKKDVLLKSSMKRDEMAAYMTEHMQGKLKSALDETAGAEDAKGGKSQ